MLSFEFGDLFQGSPVPPLFFLYECLARELIAGARLVYKTFTFSAIGLIVK